ncbi:MAG: helix-turn-helix domain-containing protein [Sarcina sp.]
MWDFKRIKEARKIRRISQEELSEISGVSQSTISKLENNHLGNAGIEVIGDLAIALNVYAPDLIQLKRKQRTAEEDIFNLGHVVEDDFTINKKED